MLKKLLSAVALVIFGVGLALVVLDVGIRIANRRFPYFYCYDADRGWGLNPGAQGRYTREGGSWLRINQDGFRGPDYPRVKPPGVLRVAVLGDSYVEAMQVEEDQTFTAVVGRMLAECPAIKGRKVEALNFAVDGYGTAQELITLRDKVWAYQPDVVVLAIFLGNDIRNNSVVLEGDRCRPFYVRDGDILRLTGPFITSPSFRLWCEARFDYRDLRLLDLFRNSFELFTHGGGAPTPEHPVERAINYSIYKPPTDRAWSDAWDVTEKLIALTRDETVRHGARFLAVTEDTGIQVWPDPQVRSHFQKHLGVDDLFYPDRRIAALGQREGFDVLTLAQPLQAYADQHHVFLHGFANTPKGFGHWNAIGHEQAGILIARKLCAMLGGGRNNLSYGAAGNH
ncbi:MAG TPA: SGNH/GDSL hydrolase family protein [Candidatus Binataceae bacterium]|nr:SGNH/GDSL hydrolase family protein [Candidatus Binataceae bacterium]